MGAATALAAASFRQHSRYRMAVAAGSATNSVFGLIRASVLVGAVASAGGTIAGYSAVEAATFAWVTQALIGPVAPFTWNDLAQRVRTGDVAVDLARPLDLQVAFLAADLGRAAFVTLPRGTPPLIVGLLTTGLALPHSPWPYLLGLLSVTLAVVVSFFCRFLVNLVAFWLSDVRGVINMYVLVSNLLSGLMLPVTWFPGTVRTLVSFTPFPSLVQVPADVLTGRVTGPDALGLLGVQVVWVVVLGLAGQVVLRRATRRLVIQGG